MRAYHASVLLPDMPASRAEIACTVHASSLGTALARIGRRIKAHTGRRRIHSVRVTVQVGEEDVKSARKIQDSKFNINGVDGGR